MRRLLFLILVAFAAAGCAGNDRTAVHGVWIPDPSFTDMMHTREAVTADVKALHDMGINTLFVCAYARTATIFPSEVYLNNSTFDNIDDCYMLAPYRNGYSADSTGFDPLRDLIDEAHKRDMKVILWFEYGFMGTHGETPADHPLLAAHPEWQSRASDGGQANYNGSDYYLNGYHEDFQNFMLDLIDEALVRYPDIDGVQCDDRMPAMPRNSGYDDYTSALYLEETGAVPPADFNDAGWVRWRLDRLNAFARRLEAVVRNRGDYMLCFSPNPYPWCAENLMQEYPAWIADGVVDLLSVQCYRFDADSYASTLNGVIESVGDRQDLLNPGIILKVGDRTIAPDVLDRQLEITREAGIGGQSFFYNEGLLDPKTAEAVKRHCR